MKAILCLLLILLATPVFAAAPINLDCTKSQIIKYYESGEYETDVSTVMSEAESYLQNRVNENNVSANPARLAVVLDIDDTSISHFVANKRNDFSLSELVRVLSKETKEPVVKPVLNFFNKAVASGTAVFFISSRPDSGRANILTVLRNAGYAGWAEVYLTTENESHLSGREFKTAKRKYIESQGYKIILNIGDQDSDLDGGYAEKTFKIPNPMYSSAEDPCLGAACK